MMELLWLFPVLFIIHDMEEVIGFKAFFNINKDMLERRYPFILKTYRDFSTEGLALAVFEELMLCVGISTGAVLTQNKYVYLLWFGVYAAFVLHLVMHLISSIIIRKYIPAVATSIVLLPICVFIMYNSIVALSCSAAELIISSLIGLMIIAVNLMLSHYMMRRFTLWLNKKKIST